MFLATHASILTPERSISPYDLTSSPSGRSPTVDHWLTPKASPVASVADLAPLYCRRMITRPVSYYALFQGWLLLSQPPGCLSNLTSFTT
jgi:hypothetical protein